MKNAICTVVGLVGAVIASALGGLDVTLRSLLIFMAADYFTGLAAAIFGKSLKTVNGGLDSRVGWLGLCRKGLILLLVLVAHRLDMTLGTDYVRNTVVIGFMANELISITENAGVLGLPMPTVIKKAIEILKKEDDDNFDDQTNPLSGR